jgi:hypothetical protein
MRKFRNGIADVVLVALIMAVSGLLTVVIEKESNNYITKVVYPIRDANITRIK